VHVRARASASERGKCVTRIQGAVPLHCSPLAVPFDSSSSLARILLLDGDNREKGERFDRLSELLCEPPHLVLAKSQLIIARDSSRYVKDESYPKVPPAGLFPFAGCSDANDGRANVTFVKSPALFLSLETWRIIPRDKASGRFPPSSLPS